MFEIPEGKRAAAKALQDQGETAVLDATGSLGPLGLMMIQRRITEVCKKADEEGDVTVALVMLFASYGLTQAAFRYEELRGGKGVG